MPILDDAKTALRFSVAQTLLDGEIQDLIDTARADLVLSGVLFTKAEDDTDPLIKRAIIVYAKANFGWDNPDSEKLKESYDMLKMHLTLSQEYTVAEVV